MTGTGMQYALFDARSPAPAKKKDEKPKAPREPKQTYTRDPATEAEYMPSPGPGLKLSPYTSAAPHTSAQLSSALCKRLVFLRTSYFPVEGKETLHAVFRDGEYRDSEYDVYAIPVSRLEKA